MPTVSVTPFPPTAPTVQTQTIPSYLYVQYNDDEDLQGFVTAYNQATQVYVSWFSSIALSIYTQLSGTLLDWIAQGLYGIVRPTLATPPVPVRGPLNSITLNAIGYPLNTFTPGAAGSYFTANDDQFQRIITWAFFKADGRKFTIPWLKRRVARFIFGAQGTAPNVADVSAISVAIASGTVTIDVSRITGVSPTILEALQYAVQGGLCEMPQQYLYTVMT